MSSTNGHKPKTMRAVVWEGKPNHVSVRDVPVPTIQMPEDAIVRITSSAICGSDAHIYRGFTGSDTPPWIMGHEAVGVVAEVGPATEQFKVGDRVLIPGAVDAGHFVVSEGVTRYYEIYGLGQDFRGDADEGMLGGCQAEYLRVPFADDSLLLIPDPYSSDLDWLFLSDIFATAWQGLDWSGFQPGDSVAVFGCGPLGLMAVYSARLRGASTIFAVDHIRSRLDKAAGVCAVPIDFTSSHLGTASEQILKIRPEGVNRCVDCVGFEAVNARLKRQQNYVINECIRVTSVDGGIGQMGLYLAQPTAPGRPRAGEIDAVYDGIELSQMWGKRITLKGGEVKIYDVLPRLYDLVKSGRVDLDFVVSAQVGIEEAPRMYERFSRGLETKVVFRFPAPGHAGEGGTVGATEGERGSRKDDGVVGEDGVNANGNRGEGVVTAKRLPIHSRKRRPFVG